MKNLCRTRSVFGIACHAVAFCIGGSIFGLIAPAPSSPAQAARSDSQQKNGVITFAERVAFQYAIEEVCWRHRIWPNENPGPKPGLDQVVSRTQIERKVEDYLRDSELLADQWQWSITPDQLQSEMDRMAAHTKQPDVLRELFAALENDPFVIAECLARPILSERLVADFLGQEKTRRFESARTETVRAPLATTLAGPPYVLPKILSAESPCTDDTWTATSTIGALSPRFGHIAVWTGIEMIVWGGSDGGLNNLNSGGRYNPSTDSWTTSSISNVPSGRRYPKAVWTGSEMIVWGGYFYDGANHYLNTGGRYNPNTDSWTATSTNNAATSRAYHTAVWTGSEMIVWGGYGSSGIVITGGRYNPSTDSWTATNTANVPTGRYRHTAVWTGNEMIVWGGTDGFPDELNTGGRYNPGTDSWTAASTVNAPSYRDSHTTVWAGSEMIVWGGVAYPVGPLYSGGRYNPGTDSWAATNTTSAPAARVDHTAVWTGSEMIVWGGSSNSGYQNTGGRYCVQPQGPMVQSAVSRKTHGSAGTFDVNLALSGTPGIECRAGDATNDYTMVVTFLANVSVNGSPQAAVTAGSGTVGSGGVSNGGIVTISGNVVTIPLTNVANAQTIDVTLNSVNGSTNITIPMSVLIGDTNANGTVNAADVAQTKGRLGQTVVAANFRSDVNGNGSINAGDTAIIKQNSGTSLPP